LIRPDKERNMNSQSRGTFSKFARLSTAATLAGLALVAASTLSGSRIALAADRPGTPNNVWALAQEPTATRAPSIRVHWNNTATEDVCFEFYSTINGSPVDLNAGCVDHGNASDEYVFEGLQPQASYCFQVRARDWNNGDPQGGYVSDAWSAPACAATDKLPTPPRPVNPPASATIGDHAVLTGGEGQPAYVSSSASGFQTAAVSLPAPTPAPRLH
jgi:hypothetical protein